MVVLFGGHLVDGRSGESLTANPIRRVVNMLQMMQKKVDASRDFGGPF